MEQLFLEHGAQIAYGLLFLGSLVEGESVVLTAGFLAYRGYLSFPLIVAISFGGSVCADQILFFVGRYYGPGLIDRHPKWQKRAQKAFDLLHKYNVWFIMGFRFIYGIRTLSPLIIGASGISVQRFVILNIISGIFWALISCGAGYLLGYFFSHAIDEAMKSLMHYQKMAAFGLIGLVAFIGLAVFGRAHYRKKRENQDL